MGRYYQCPCQTRTLQLYSLKSTVYIIGYVLVATTQAEILYGTPHWSVASAQADQHFLWSASPPIQIYNFSDPHPFAALLYPPINLSIKSPTVFSDAELRGIYDATAIVQTYIQSFVHSPITITLESTTNAVYDFPLGFIPLGMAYVNDRRILLFTENLQGSDIFLVLIHEILHVLGFGTNTWYATLHYQGADLQYTGALPTALANRQNISVDIHSGAHWSDDTVLSMGKHNDVMNRYLHEKTHLSAESFSVVQENNHTLLTRACYTTSDCDLIYAAYNTTHDTAYYNVTWICSRITPIIPGVCRTISYCTYHSCTPHGSTSVPPQYRLTLACAMLVYLCIISFFRHCTIQ